jgi:histidine triad (HIT) family protein
LAKTPLGDFIVGIAFGNLTSLLPVKRVKETDKVLAFYHPKPFWERHILIVPKKAIKKMTLLREEDLPYIDDIFRVIREIVMEMKWEEGGYSVLINGGDRQEVGQLHFHLYSGKQGVC